MPYEQRARHSPAARGFFRKRRPLLNSVITTDVENLPLSLSGPVTLTFVSTLVGSSSNTASTTLPSIQTSTAAAISSTSVSSTRSSSSSSFSSSSSSTTTARPTTTPSPSVSAVTSSATSTKSNSSDNTANGQTNNNSSTLSGGAVAAISIGVLVLLAAAAVLIGHRYMARRRQRRRTTARWLSGLTPAAGTRSDSSGNQPSMTMVNPSYGDGYAYTGTLPASGGMHTTGIAPPPTSYSNVPATAGSSPRTTTAVNRAAVRCTFVPNFPDELTILNGEMLDILQEFDDGWVLCVNSRGEKGMVPLECLASGSDAGSEFYGDRSLRSSRRLSSMTGARI